MSEVQLTKAGEQMFNVEIPNFLYRIIVHETIHGDREVFVLGSSVLISAAGDIVIKNGVDQRVFGAATGKWWGFYIVDQETFEPVPEFFPKVAYD